MDNLFELKWDVLRLMNNMETVLAEVITPTYHWYAGIELSMITL